MRSKLFVAAAVAAALALGVGAGTVFASGGQAQMPHRAGPKPLVTSGGPPCAMATTASRGFTPLGNGFVPAGAVTIKKRCAGPLTALLTAQAYSLAGTNGLVYVYAQATCVGTGGFPHACIHGSVHGATPPNQNNPEDLNGYSNSYTAEAINLSWGGLPPGIYKIQVFAAGGTTNDAVGYRTLQAIAWTKG